MGFKQCIFLVATILNALALSTVYPISEQVARLRIDLFSVAARTARGEIARSSEKIEALSLIENLEGLNTNTAPARACIGNWDLIYTNTQLFRSSPFFMAARMVCKDGDEADRFNYFCDLHREALRFTTIGRVRQIISSTQLVSEFESNVAVLPGLPLVVKGTIRSVADIESIDDDSWTLLLDTVTIKQGSSNIPGLGSFLDSYSGLPLRPLSRLLQDNIQRYTIPKPVFRTTYLDEDIRISRDQDNNAFVYKRCLD